MSNKKEKNYDAQQRRRNVTFFYQKGYGCKRVEEQYGLILSTSLIAPEGQSRSLRHLW